MGHKSEILSHKLSKGEDARLGRWTSVGHAKQVAGRAGIKAALTIFYRCKKCGMRPTDGFMLFLMRKR